MSWTLITGSAKRLGAEIALSLAKKGYPIVIHYNTSEQEAEAMVLACRMLGVAAECIQGDFSTPEGVQKFIQTYNTHFPDTSNLINNVGNYLVKNALSTTDGEWLSLFQTNLNTPFSLIRSLIPSIKKNKGAVINIGVAGIESARADTYASAYSATKYALWMLTKTLAKELAGDGIRVNMVSPGLLENAVDLDIILSRVPMKSATSLKEITRLIEFLLDSENKHLTGQNIEIAGGLRL